MSKKSALAELRDRLSDAVRNLGDQALSSRELAIDFRNRNHAIIKAASTDLELIALIKLVAEVSNRRSKPTLVPSQGDLFLEFSVPEVVVIPARSDAKAKVRRHFLKLTLAEANVYLSEHSRAREANYKRNAAIRKLLKAITPFMTEEMTIEEGWAAKVAAEQKETLLLPS